jgi:hypothetical protein
MFSKLFRKLVNRVFPENNSGWIEKLEIIHVSLRICLLLFPESRV